MRGMRVAILGVGRLGAFHAKVLSETKDVDESEQLVCEFGNCVPVVAINGKVRFRGQVNEVLLRRLLEANP